MTFIILHYVSIYLIIGFISAWIINQVIIATQSSEPYTPGEIFMAIILWPINVTVFIVSLIVALFR
jgi:hypothetical protein